MVATRASRITSRLASSVLLLGSVLLACSSSSDSSSPSSSPHPPQLANFQVFPGAAAVNEGGGAVTVGFGAEEFDAGADVNRATVTVLTEDGTKVSELSDDLQNPPGVTHASIGGQIAVPTGAVATYTVRFQLFDAGGSGSNVVEAPFHVVPGNPVPTITSVSPTSVTAGAASLTLTVTGSGFLPSSTLAFNGYVLSASYVDASTIEAPVPPYLYYSPGTAQITAWNPSPGGGTSAPYPFTIDPPPPSPVPTITAMSPTSAVAGSPSLTLTVTGTGFVPSSSVQWNGSWMSTTFVDATTLQALIPSYSLYGAGTAQITVVNPLPGGGTSEAWTFTIDPQPPRPTPVLTAISPTSALAGSPSVTLTVTGTGFVPSSSVQWNGSWMSTTFVDATTLQAVIQGYSLSTAGTVNISVYTPSPGGGVSSSLPFTVRRPIIPGVTPVKLQANDLAWDPYQRKLYASVPSVSAVNPNTITVIDPFTGELGASQFAGSEPGPLSLSDDGRLLYVGLGGAALVTRLALPALTLDLEIPLGRDATYGPYYARDVQVAPGAPDAVAVALQAGTYYGISGGVAIFDDRTPRSTRVAGTSGSFGSLQWGADASVLYGSSIQYSSSVYAMSVDASGVAITQTWSGSFNTYGTRIHFDPGTGLLYGDDGRAMETVAGLPVGTFSLTGLNYSPTFMAPDSSLDSAFFVGGTSSWPQLRAYDLHRYVQRASLDLPYFANPTARVVRFGQDGVAFLTSSEIVLVRGATVLPVAGTPNPAPAATSLVPSGAVPGSANLRLTVTGSGFVPGSVVRWDGSDRTTRFVSATQLVAFIPASDVAAAGSSQVTVASPEPGGGASNAVTFSIGP